MQRLTNLYDSEINFAISTFWDSGYYWKLGDEANGFKAEGNTDCLTDAIGALHEAALRHYPNSVYARELSHPVAVKPDGISVVS